MIRTQWWHDGAAHSGGAEQIKQWQQQGGSLWIDLADEPETQEATLLRELGCHPLAIQDAQRQRHPPKVEDFLQSREMHI